MLGLWARSLLQRPESGGGGGEAWLLSQAEGLGGAGWAQLLLLEARAGSEGVLRWGHCPGKPFFRLGRQMGPTGALAQLSQRWEPVPTWELERISLPRLRRCWVWEGGEVDQAERKGQGTASQRIGG